MGERHRRQGARSARPASRTAAGPDFYIGQTSVVGDAPGHLVFAYEGPTTTGGPQRVYVSTSTDGGRTWSAGMPLSVNGENATRPAPRLVGRRRRPHLVHADPDGDNPDAWNVWYRSSSNGGASWSSPVKISDAPAGAAGYIGADGFGEIYGDYGEIAVTNTARRSPSGARGSATRAPAAAGSTSSADAP